MRLLVTRPQPGADETAARLRAMGHEVLVQPLTTIVFNRQPAIGDRPAAIVFTSRNAIRAVATWEMPADWLELPVFAVGAATAAAARQAGFGDVRSGDSDVAGLGALIRRTFDRRPGAILHLGARDRAGSLASALAGTGFTVAEIEVYRAVPAERFDPAVRAALSAGDIDGVLFHSRRSASVFVELLATEGLDKARPGGRLLTLSARVAEPLAGLDGGAIEIAAHPDEAALLALVAEPREDGRGAIPPL